MPYSPLDLGKLLSCLNAEPDLRYVLVGGMAIEDLLAMKREAGRNRDRVDINQRLAIQRLRDEQT